MTRAERILALADDLRSRVPELIALRDAAAAAEEAAKAPGVWELDPRVVASALATAKHQLAVARFRELESVLTLTACEADRE